jgi:putative selenate reductase
MLEPMSDRFHPLPLELLTAWIADELEAKNSVFGIPRALFFIPNESDPFRSTVYGHALEAPLGVAAGPHSQLAQNIVIAWLCGARFIELKTVQTLDRIEVSKPCIDMQDEGYNVEWSQELRVEESYTEYLKAWVLIHALHRRLGFPGDNPGVIFNLSVGYDLEGIRRENVQWFLDKAENAGADLDEAVDLVSRRLPEVLHQPIPACMSDNVTLSTMHGCPPDEIGAICGYLLGDRGLHTSVKLNPTLLGPERLRPILNDRLGFTDVIVADKAFEDDLDYADALSMLRKLAGTAKATAAPRPHGRARPPSYRGRRASPRDVVLGRRRQPQRGSARPLRHEDRHRLLRPPASGRVPPLRPIPRRAGDRDGRGRRRHHRNVHSHRNRPAGRGSGERQPP